MKVSDGGSQDSKIWFFEIGTAVSPAGVFVVPGFADAVDETLLVPSEFNAYTLYR